MNDGKLSLNETKVSSNMASLEHPTTLRIFLYCLDKMNSISVREAQRDLELNSPNTVTWHFEKLLRDNLIERGSNSQYNITEIGSSQRSFSLPTQLQYRYIRGKLIDYRKLDQPFDIIEIFDLFINQHINNSIWLIVDNILKHFPNGNYHPNTQFEYFMILEYL